MKHWPKCDGGGFEKEALVMIVQGCKQLANLDVLSVSTTWCSKRGLRVIIISSVRRPISLVVGIIVGNDMIPQKFVG